MNRALLILFVFFFVGFGFAQNEISKAKKLIQEGNCSEAIPILQDPKIKFTTHAGAQATVLLTECFLREHKRDEVLNLASRFLEYHTSSEYRERMELAHAIATVEKGSIYDGLEAMLRILAYSKNPAARAHTKDVAIQTLASSLLNADQLQSLLEKYPVDKDAIGWMQLQIGRESQNAGRYRSARYWYKKVLSNNGIQENLKTTAEQGIESLKGASSGLPTILVLAPLTGELADFGIATLQGVYLAHEQSNLKDKIAIRFADTRADAAQALMRTQQAINQDSIIAIIGPIMSAPAVTVAAWLGSNYPNIPLLTPTATDGGIAKLGPNIFQINVTMDNLAQSIADFATNCLSIREFAILSPVGDYGSITSQSFAQAVDRRGGKVFTTRNFKEGRSDYKTELNLIRDARFKQENRRKNIAKGMKDIDSVNVEELRKYVQSAKVKIPGIFIPSTTPSSAGTMVAQLENNKISGTLLGTSGWYGIDLLIQGKDLLKRSYFSVPALDINENEESFNNFAKDFLEKWGTEPDANKVSGLSYDAANIVFTAFNQNPDDINSYINKAPSFTGVYGEIIFTRGANTNTKIITVHKGSFETINKCKVPQVEEDADDPEESEVVVEENNKNTTKTKAKKK